MGWARSDDLTGSVDNVEEVVFGANGQLYAIDLDAENRAAFHVMLAKYVEAGRPVGDLSAQGTAPVESRQVPASSLVREPRKVSRKAVAAKAKKQASAPVKPKANAVPREAAAESVAVEPTKATPKQPAAKGSAAGTRRAPGTADGKKRDIAVVRAWAAENGMGLPATGRIPNSVLVQFDAAHAQA